MRWREYHRVLFDIAGLLYFFLSSHPKRDSLSVHAFGYTFGRKECSTSLIHATDAFCTLSLFFFLQGSLRGPTACTNQISTPSPQYDLFLLPPFLYQFSPRNDPPYDTLAFHRSGFLLSDLPNYFKQRLAFAFRVPSPISFRFFVPKQPFFFFFLLACFSLTFDFITWFALGRKADTPASVPGPLGLSLPIVHYFAQ